MRVFDVVHVEHPNDAGFYAIVTSMGVENFVGRACVLSLDDKRHRNVLQDWCRVVPQKLVISNGDWHLE